MLRGDELILKNRNLHIDPQRDNDIHVYAYKGNLYFRVGNGQPKLIGGQTYINQIIQTETGVTGNVNFRGGRSVFATAGEYGIVFDTPLGNTGTDYNLTFFVRDANGAVPAFDIPPGNMTKYGFTVVTYDDNITFGWTAILNSQ